MQLQDLIDANIPLLKSTDSAEDALLFMDEEHLSQMVLLNDQEIEIYEEEALLSFNSEMSLKDIQPKFSGISLPDYTHLVQAADFVLKLNLHICPVIDENEKYIGIVRSEDIFKEVLIRQFEGEGSVIGLKVNHIDYSLADISRIVEAEGLKIEQLFLEKKEASEYHFLIKFNKKEAINGIRSLKRFGYQVEKVLGPDQDSGIDHERYGLLMKYLEI
ncbi:CBS domain-containing protein [Jiulongibacter sp. NS-SX5]|uniref:CBS domain-containing protein n=1 Tax=Jiulongibacter sp. NS-SX5 TaxID=3463854 RepID=UPI0040597FF9